MPERSPLAEALAGLDEAMRPSRGRSSDPDRRRAAARLAELARCEDDELLAFAKRHLPGRAVDEPSLRAARDMLLALGRVVGPDGSSSVEALEALQDAHHALQDAHYALEARLADAQEAMALSEAEAAAGADTSPAPIERLVESVPVIAAPASVPVPAPAPVPVPMPALVGVSPRSSDPLAWPVDADATFTLGPGFKRPVLPVLPFVQTPAPPVEPLPRSEPPASRAELPGSGTVSSGSKRPAKPALPFIQAAAELPRTSTASSEIERSAQPALPFMQAASEERASSAAAPSPVSLAGAISMQSPPSLTLNQYAGLVVACELYPSHVESTHALYGVPTAAARAALDAFWASRFAADPALVEQWWELCAAARRYFLQSR
jgi:hypothetical protein